MFTAVGVRATNQLSSGEDFSVVLNINLPLVYSRYELSKPLVFQKFSVGTKPKSRMLFSESYSRKQTAVVATTFMDS